MEHVAIITLIVCIVALLAELVWLYFLSERQESRNKQQKKDSEYIMQQLQGIKKAPDARVRGVETDTLASFVASDKFRLNTLADILLNMILENREEDLTDIVGEILTKVRPIDFYNRLLRQGNTADKAVACQKLALFFGQQAIPEIRRLMEGKNKELRYNAAMALSRLGDEESVVKYILSLNNDFETSHRLIIEFLEQYSGDLQALCTRIFEKAEDYIRATVIKGIAKHRFAAFHNMYREGVLSQNRNMAAACIRALGYLAHPEDEHTLITAAHHKDWVLRSTAVKALGNFSTEKALAALQKATQDPEWWVRYNAAHSLAQQDDTLQAVESVLGGYDRYAADAMKYALYRQPQNAGTEKG